MRSFFHSDDEENVDIVGVDEKMPRIDEDASIAVEFEIGEQSSTSLTTTNRMDEDSSIASEIEIGEPSISLKTTDSAGCCSFIQRRNF